MGNYSKEKKEKLANTIIFFAEKIPDLSKTKLIKLLYLLEECYVKKYNIPLLDIDFEVWQAGPVNRDIFIELSDEPIMFNGYIERVCTPDNTIIKSIKEFSDNEFSDNELEMMQFIVKQFGNKTAKDLIEYIHRPGSAWYIIAEKNGLLPLFNNGFLNSSEEKIDFGFFFCEDEMGITKYKEQKAFNSLVQYFEP